MMDSLSISTPEILESVRNNPFLGRTLSEDHSNIPSPTSDKSPIQRENSLYLNELMDVIKRDEEKKNTPSPLISSGFLEPGNNLNCQLDTSINLENMLFNAALGNYTPRSSPSTPEVVRQAFDGIPPAPRYPTPGAIAASQNNNENNAPNLNVPSDAQSDGQLAITEDSLSSNNSFSRLSDASDTAVPSPAEERTVSTTIEYRPLGESATAHNDEQLDEETVMDFGGTMLSVKRERSAAFTGAKCVLVSDAIAPRMERPRFLRSIATRQQRPQTAAPTWRGRDLAQPVTPRPHSVGTPIDEDEGYELMDDSMTDTESVATPRPDSAYQLPPPRKYTRRKPPKESPEYRERRDRNNEAVRRSRAKAKAGIDSIKMENDGLKERIRELEITVDAQNGKIQALEQFFHKQTGKKPQYMSASSRAVSKRRKFT